MELGVPACGQGILSPSLAVGVCWASDTGDLSITLGDLCDQRRMGFTSALQQKEVVDFLSSAELAVCAATGGHCRSILRKTLEVEAHHFEIYVHQEYLQRLVEEHCSDKWLEENCSSGGLCERDCECWMLGRDYECECEYWRSGVRWFE